MVLESYFHSKYLSIMLTPKLSNFTRVGVQGSSIFQYGRCYKMVGSCAAIVTQHPIVKQSVNVHTCYLFIYLFLLDPNRHQNIFTKKKKAICNVVLQWMKSHFLKLFELFPVFFQNCLIQQFDLLQISKQAKLVQFSYTLDIA